jgi:hypothetical protein
MSARPALCSVAVALALCALVGCGSSSSTSQKQAQIAAALRKFEREFIAGKRDAQREFPCKNELGTLTLVSAPPPRGVSEAEWNAAVKQDKRLQRLKSE